MCSDSPTLPLGGDVRQLGVKMSSVAMSMVLPWCGDGRHLINPVWVGTLEFNGEPFDGFLSNTGDEVSWNRLRGEANRVELRR